MRLCLGASIYESSTNASQAIDYPKIYSWIPNKMEGTIPASQIRLLGLHAHVRLVASDGKKDKGIRQLCVVPFKLIQEKLGVSQHERETLSRGRTSERNNEQRMGPNRDPHPGQSYCVGGPARGREICGPRLGGVVDIVDQMAMALRAIFARRLMESCKPMPNRPAPECSTPSDLRQGRRPAAGRIGRCPKVGRALRHGSLAHSSISGYVAKWLRGIMGTMASAADGLLPRHGPPATPRIAGPCFLQDSMHGDSYPCCRPSIRLCLPAYSSKAPTDVEIAASFPGVS
jgi:hypothetical protein